MVILQKNLTDKVKAYLESEGAIVTVSDSLDVYTNNEIMDNTDLIFQSVTMTKLPPARKEDCLMQ